MDYFQKYWISYPNARKTIENSNIQQLECLRDMGTFKASKGINFINPSTLQHFNASTSYFYLVSCE